MSDYRKWHLIRWMAWSFVWAFFHPELLSLNGWISDPSLFLPGVFFYLLTGVVLEMLYRKLAWGQLAPKRPFITAIVPDCPDHPWVSLIRKYPDDAERPFEVFCADGVTRPARLAMMFDFPIIAIMFTAEEQQKSMETPWKVRPTHWRYLKLDAANGITAG